MANNLIAKTSWGQAIFDDIEEEERNLFDLNLGFFRPRHSYSSEWKNSGNIYRPNHVQKRKLLAKDVAILASDPKEKISRERHPLNPGIESHSVALNFSSKGLPDSEVTTIIDEQFRNSMNTTENKRQGAFTVFVVEELWQARQMAGNIPHAYVILGLEDLPDHQTLKITAVARNSELVFSDNCNEGAEINFFHDGHSPRVEKKYYSQYREDFLTKKDSHPEQGNCTEPGRGLLPDNPGGKSPGLGD